MNVPTVLPRSHLHAALRSGQDADARSRVVRSAFARITQTTKGTIVTPLAPAAPKAGGGTTNVVPRWG